MNIRLQYQSVLKYSPCTLRYLWSFQPGPKLGSSENVGLGDFNCSIYLGIQAYLYTRLINLGPINNKIFSRADMP